MFDDEKRNNVEEKAEKRLIGGLLLEDVVKDLI